mmetsp:Transcript_24962/g.36823  ORF Transcript_24962/g.36823 Transcript_24962/m.36823 type:complete len:401 (-) Transcript_24962:166-1368(-)|eukprot:CAMPEP_0185017568 /NCGR_PEP_ID=MMETSP1103-20130426/497_1 /TAXON_ID=36769 /ORGANISM="Paraphysomonas bandaiensis, Strain Caron Lab Isolate" /LENGTH=400 /DNA_ID=CAMNT_0027547037 /DNA_START=63 /DNA_END=1265 /DNA_ORIENTATION=-
MFKAVLVSAALAYSTAAELRAAAGKKIFGQYIVRLHDNEKVDTLRDHIQEMQEALGGDMEPMFTYESLAEHKFVGYATKLSSFGLDVVMKQDIVDYVEEDQVVDINDCQSESNPDWGIARANHHNYSYTNTYTYDYTTGNTGNNVDAYIIDTGIYCENNEFTGKTTGSCTFGYSSVKNIFGVVDETDGNGHGTHCAGTVAGITYGVAKEANLIAVKVLSDAGSGSTSGVISGIDWVTQQSQTTGRRSVANLSLGGGFSQTQNDAIEAATSAGVTMVVAAGNDNSDACNYSPASAPSAVTVGATDKTNSRASYSNYGSCVDIFGPGSSITSAWIGSPDATNTISGTSMASPHVCGTAAKYLSADNSLTVAEVTSQLLSEASKNEISDVKGSPNLMVYGYCS